MLDQTRDTWTPDLVKETLIEATRWLHLWGRPAGPGGYALVRLQRDQPSLEEHLAEGWGIPEEAPQDDDRAAEREAERLRFRMALPRQVSRWEDALCWPGRYVAPEWPVPARVLQLWLAAQVSGIRFAAEVRKIDGLSRGAAYSRRDAALVAISVALDREGVPIQP